MSWRKTCSFIKNDGIQCLEIIKNPDANFCQEHEQIFENKKSSTVEETEAARRLQIELIRQDFNKAALLSLEKIGLLETICVITDTVKIICAVYSKRKVYYDLD